MALKNEFEQKGGDGATLIQANGPLTYNYYSPDAGVASNYKNLVNEYKKECESPDSQLHDIISKIQHFIDSADSEFVGLEKKLRDAGFENDIQWAMSLKEKYTKYLTTNNLSKATQKIHAFLLAKIYVAFNLYIPDAVRENKTKGEIRDILLNKIIKPVEVELGIDNILELYQDDVLAMVYFLTGNCHIKWGTNDNIPSSI